MAVFLLIALAGTCSIVGPVHVARAKKRMEPEVVIHPKNVFERTLRVVGDADYKPFSYFHNDETEPHGYDIELVSELVNRMGSIWTCSSWNGRTPWTGCRTGRRT